MNFMNLQTLSKQNEMVVHANLLKLESHSEDVELE